MAFPVAGGHPSMSGGYIPEIWSGKLIEKFYPASTIAAIANTDYEGEITAHGDKVIIRTVPDIEVRDYQAGQDLVYDDPQGGKVELLIDKGAYFGFNIDDVEKCQSDLDYMNKWSNDASEQMKSKVDKRVFADIYADADAANAGATAGKDSGDINLGTAAAPLVVNGDNIVDLIVDMGTVLDEQNVPESGRYLVLPPRYAALIKKSELKDASITGDPKSIIRNGLLGTVDRFTIYQSNHMNRFTVETKKAVNVVFGHKAALTFATQITKNETLRNPKRFGDLVRGLQVYGFEVINPVALGHAALTIG